MDNFDVIIIGGGAAGLSAALVLARARRSVLVVDSGMPRNRPATHMHGFLSRDGMPPGDLLAAGRAEIERYGGTIVDGAVIDAVRDGSRFRVVRAEGPPVAARRLLVTTGLTDELPELPGLRERWARDVLHCPYCHGFEVRDRTLAVLGGTGPAVAYAQIVRQWTDDLTYVTPRGTLTADEREGLAARGIAVAEGTAQRIVVQGDRLAGIEFDDGSVVPCDALFVPPRFVPHNGLLARLGCDLDEHGWAVVDGGGRTSAPGVWVAGNVANPRAQVITAAGEGSAAAIAINADLVEDDVREAVHALRRTAGPDPTAHTTKEER